MAKERNLPSKTTLTTSDYIRVVGSDNASYKQSVSDVADKMLTLGKSASTAGTISDLDAVTPFTTGYATFAASVSPTGEQSAFWYSMIGWGTGGRVEITCIDVSGTVYTKVKDYSGWKAWVKQPTRAEMDALNSNSVLTLTPNTEVLSSAGASNMSARRKGNIVYISGYVQMRADSSVPKDTTLFTIPWGHRPAVTITSMAARVDNNVISPEVAIVNTNGVVVLHNGTASPANAYVRFSIMYPVE